MRVQKLSNDRMRPGNKQASLSKFWGQAKVLVIEECSMVAALWYNMLDVRSMHGRSLSHDVYETTYKKPGHHFGRIPIVIHLGDFLQLAPTANISLIEDVNAKLDDGSYKYPEPPSVEAQHATALARRFTADARITQDFYEQMRTRLVPRVRLELRRTELPATSLLFDVFALLPDSKEVELVRALVFCRMPKK